MAHGILTRREFLRAAGVGATGLAMRGRLGLAAAAAPAGRRPNIVLIVSDDQGYAELGCQGCTDIPTLNIDSLATGGVRFTQAYVSCPVCSPTRAGLLTGRYQQRFGHEFNPGGAGAANFGLPLSEKTLADRLRAAGYATGMVGKWHLGNRPDYVPTKRGFDEFFGFLGGAHPYVKSGIGTANPILRGTEAVDETEYLTDAFAREAVAFIDRQKDQKDRKERPFFLYLPFNAVHAPMQAPEKYTGRFDRIADPLRKTFAGMLSAMDDAVGAVLAKLRKEKLEDNTLILFFSDNGGPTRQTSSRNDPLRGFKGQALEGGIRVPALMQWKGVVKGGLVYDKPVIALDFAPTVLAAAGVGRNADARFDGVDLAPFITGRNAARPHETLCWRFGAQRAIRHGDMKLVWPGKVKAELYDLAADAGEAKDLADAKPEVVKDLQERFENWNAELAEPLWRGGAATRPAATRRAATRPRAAARRARALPATAPSAAE